MAGCRVKTSAALSITCLLMQIISMVSPGWLIQGKNFSGFWMNCTVDKDSMMNCPLLDLSSSNRDPDERTFNLVVIALESMAILLFVMATISSCFMYCEEKAQCAAICSICNNLVAALVIIGGLVLYVLKLAGSIKVLFICFYMSCLVSVLALTNVIIACLFYLPGDNYSM